MHISIAKKVPVGHLVRHGLKYGRIKTNTKDALTIKWADGTESTGPHQLAWMVELMQDTKTVWT